MSTQQHIQDSREDENESFKLFLRGSDPEEIDQLVYAIQEKVTAMTDCTVCGNCCRSLMINVEQEELEPLGIRLRLPVTEIKNRFIEESSQGQLIINTIPCHFLNNSKCTIYEDRFTECREFPHLHKKGFLKRLFGIFMHYDRCPIICNTIEKLKTETAFYYEK
ncbi:MAG: YkgJ family cysteine cluster protein [Chitinophagaceae bacterium]